ncbi:MAG: hypothetical protein WCJ30_00010 [Deltaproteobacteria bacterium]
MAYRENVRDIEPLSVLRFRRTGPLARWAVAALCAAVTLFVLAMGAWTAEDSFLECVRPPGARASCTELQTFPLGIARRIPVPPIRGVRTDRRIGRNRGGSYTYSVLVLEHEAVAPTEFQGVGTRGARAGEVGNGLVAFLDSDEPGPRRWPLRESAYVITALMLVLGGFMLALGVSGFRSARVTFDPGERRVTVAVNRWPARVTTWSAPLDAIDRAERTVRQDRNGAIHSVILPARDVPVAGGLDLAYRGEASANAVVGAINEALARWRER